MVKVNKATGELVDMDNVRDLYGRPRVQKHFTKPSLTRQEFKEQCDLERIIKRFAQTPDGMRALQNAQGFIEGLRFEDVTTIPDYRTALDAVNAADAKFMALPAVVRRQFENDPAQFLDFCKDPNNLDQLRVWGLAKPAHQDAAESPSSAKET